VLWTTGSFTTYSQSDWHTGFSTLVDDHYNAVYQPTGAFVIGDLSKYSLQFDSGEAVSDYLPQPGAPAALNGTIFDPTDSASGSFGGDVAALKLNVDFADAGLLTANSGLTFGDLTICALTSDTDLNDKTIRQFLTTANTALGAEAHVDSIADLDSVTSQVTASFASITPTDWAQAHLQPGACP
jgi:hypothetical protein